MGVMGECRSDFARVREEFERNFHDRGEVGASLCVKIEGVPVVDLWGGLARRDPDQAWERDTLGVVWSCTKGAVALCTHILVSRGVLDLDAPVAHYWPEFGQAGKEEITLRLVLDHQAGVPVFRTPLPPGSLYDWEVMTNALATEAPFWTSGTRQGYHGATFGHLLGEVIRRVAGTDLGTFFRTEVAEPLGLDFHLGLGEKDEVRVAPTLRADPVPRGETPWRFLTRMNEDPNSVQALMMRNAGRRPGDQDSREAHAALLPSQGGITNARGLAGLYEPLALGGSVRGVRLLDGDTLAALQAVSSASAVDAVLLVGLRFGLGFMKSSDNRRAGPGARDSLILAESAFGHAGMGGSLGFADPEARLAFGYTMNKQGRGILLNERGQVLIDAVYRSLGYGGNRSGRWVRDESPSP